MKKYQIIYADPPWAYNESGSGNRVVSSKYPTMQIEEIIDLPIKNLIDENCILFLWVTFPRLPEGLELIKAWGFDYKGLAFNWVKRNKKSDSNFWGMGYFTRQNSEILLIGVKGKIKKGIASAGEHSVYNGRIEEHSKKPDYIRNKIPSLVENGESLNKLELFARQKTEGWDVWGNEVESNIELSLIPQS